MRILGKIALELVLQATAVLVGSAVVLAIWFILDFFGISPVIML